MRRCADPRGGQGLRARGIPSLAADALAFKALRRQCPEYQLWRDFPYEYDRLTIDLITGGELLRQWVDDPKATPDDLEILARTDEASWISEREAVLR